MKLIMIVAAAMMSFIISILFIVVFSTDMSSQMCLAGTFF